ncbi:LPP20 family lipoprotein [Sulfurimonas sp.]|nr:LPP20 family lipoprotein [Sulfurimonas sp.]
MLSRTVLITLVIFIFSGCVSEPSPVEQKAPRPAWVDQPVQSDDVYMYGIAIGENREDAVKLALSDMVSKLGTSIESKFQSSEESQGGYYKATHKNSIKADVAKIKINNYEVLKSHRISYREFAVIVQTQRDKFIIGLSNSLKKKASSLEKELKQLNTKSTIARYNLSKKLYEKSKSLYSDVIIISEVDRRFNKTKFINFIDSIRDRFYKEKNSLNFIVRGDRNSQKFVKNIEEFLANKGFNVSSRVSSSTINVKLKTSANIDSDDSIAVFNIDINVKSSIDKIGGNSIVLKERYKGSKNSVFKNASIHFEQDLKEQGINEVLGISLDLE